MALTRTQKYRTLEIGLLIVAALSAALLVINLVSPRRYMWVLFLAGLLFTASLLALFRIWFNPDRVRASQSNAMLNLASNTLSAIGAYGLSSSSAQKICEYMLPATSAMAVAITDTEKILGYAGRDQKVHQAGEPIRTTATRAVLADGHMRVLQTQEEIGFPSESSVRAAIIAPLRVGDETIGTLKFYYPSARRLTETEESIATGFAELISTQVSAHALEDQRKLATSMELKVLQSQINPHFLFNTINTIASLVRTDPDQARELLRDFASFYRRTLEDASDLVPLQREVEQTERYLRFELARFGEERIQLTCNIDKKIAECLVPAFMIQPLVENAVRHAMPSVGTLHISCSAHREGADLTIVVADDGIGMSEAASSQLLQGENSEGLGMALRNIQERIRGYYGPESFMEVKSKEGQGTSILLFLKGSCLR